MNVNPYQSPASVCERPGNRGEPAKERRFRRLISLGEILLWLYNAQLFGFLAFLLLNLTLQVFGLSLPELAAAGFAIVLCTVAVVGALGNAYVLYY